MRLRTNPNRIFRINRLTFSSNLHDIALSTRYNIKKAEQICNQSPGL